LWYEETVAAFLLCGEKRGIKVTGNFPENCNISRKVFNTGVLVHPVGGLRSDLLLYE